MRPMPKSEELVPTRGQFAGLSVADLQRLYLEEVGRSTDSEDRKYLEWKLRLARAGKVRTGPRRPREGIPDRQLVPIRLEVYQLEAIDDAWNAVGMPDRMTFFRKAFVAQLKVMLKEAKSKRVKKVISEALLAFEEP